jgi:hypothetical protein
MGRSLPTWPTMPLVSRGQGASTTSSAATKPQTERWRQSRGRPSFPPGQTLHRHTEPTPRCRHDLWFVTCVNAMGARNPMPSLANRTITALRYLNDRLATFVATLTWAAPKLDLRRVRVDNRSSPLPFGQQFGNFIWRVTKRHPEMGSDRGSSSSRTYGPAGMLWIRRIGPTDLSSLTQSWSRCSLSPILDRELLRTPWESAPE